MRTFAQAVSLSVAGLAVTVVVAIAASGPFARWLGSRRWVAAFVLLGFGLVLSATLVPTDAALDGQASSGVCDVSRVGLLSIRELTTVNESSLNVLLFAPLGFAVGLLPWTRTSAVVVVAAVSLTFVVESIQLLLPVLGRGCQTADMFDNLLGLAIGMALGVVARPIVRRI